MITLRYGLISLWFSTILIQSIHVLISYTDPINQKIQDEILFGHGFVMLALSIPLGWVALFIVGAALSWFEITLTSVWDAVCVSIVCVSIGYLQWFVLLPWLWHKWKAKYKLESS